MAGLFFDLDSWWGILSVVTYFLIVATAVYVVLSENRNPIRSLAWVIAVIFLPFVGLLFYFFFGRSLRGMRMISRSNKRKLMHRRMRQRVDIPADTVQESRRNLVKLSNTLCRTPLTLGNDIDIFTDGHSKFEALKRDLRNAKEQILLQYYIFNDDVLGHEIADILIDKAREGVKVKVLYDHVGSFGAKGSFFKSMRNAGVAVHPFFKVTFPQLANRINWRNHRKVVVIDNAIGYIGGMNIADRYVNGPGKGRVWRDTHYRITGDIVEQLYYSFMIDWNFKSETTDLAVFKRHGTPSTECRNGMQFVQSGPTSPYDSLAMIFLKAIASANKCVYIQTPYFLPADALLHALEMAALSRVDVRIMIPARSDSRMLQLASYSYVTQCLRAGIKIYLYKPGMLHAKMLIVDEDLVSTGSTNFDFRSLENNFECNLMVYDREFNSTMRKIFFQDLEQCEKVRLSEWRRRPLPQRAGESVVRLMAPIL